MVVIAVHVGVAVDLAIEPTEMDDARLDPIEPNVDSSGSSRHDSHIRSYRSCVRPPFEDGTFGSLVQR